jgi:3-methylcrotonyl-CoA carboxylase alpha subunit
MSAVRLRLGGRIEEVRLAGEGEASVGGRPVSYRRTVDGPGAARIEADGRVHRVVVARAGAKTFVWCDGAVYAFERAHALRPGAASDSDAGLLAPMPGRVRRVFVEAGQAVERGTVLLALEAMKMEHAIRAPRDAVVLSVRVAEGDLVEAGAELVELS